MHHLNFFELRLLFKLNGTIRKRTRGSDICIINFKNCKIKLKLVQFLSIVYFKYDFYSAAKIKRRKKRSYGAWTGGSMIPDDMGNVIERPVCRLRYQQSPVDVYAHFMASDHDSGRVTYLVNRRTWLRVTDLVLPLLRVSDPRIATLRGRILQGRSMGRTEVQVSIKT